MVYSSKLNFRMITIKQGSKGPEVKTLQQKLNLAVDGIFGLVTDEAVRNFQKSKGLTADGIVGNKTWAHLVLLVRPNALSMKSSSIAPRLQKDAISQ